MKHKARGGALRLGRVSSPGAIYFITTNIREKQPIIVPAAREAIIEYMRQNPVRRGLVAKPEDYEWSTAHPSRQNDVDWHALQELGWME